MKQYSLCQLEGTSFGAYVSEGYSPQGVFEVVDWEIEEWMRHEGTLAVLTPQEVPLYKTYREGNEDRVEEMIAKRQYKDYYSDEMPADFKIPEGKLYLDTTDAVNAINLGVVRYEVHRKAVKVNPKRPKFKCVNVVVKSGEVYKEKGKIVPLTDSQAEQLALKIGYAYPEDRVEIHKRYIPEEGSSSCVGVVEGVKKEYKTMPKNIDPKTEKVVPVYMYMLVW